MASEMFDTRQTEVEKILLEAYASKDKERIKEAIVACNKFLEDAKVFLTHFDNPDKCNKDCFFSCQHDAENYMESLRILVQFIHVRNYHPWAFNNNESIDKVCKEVWEPFN